MNKLPVITLWQPWATLIDLGWKTIETRLHNKFSNLLNKTIGIHAGMKWDKDWAWATRDYLSSEQKHLIYRIKLENRIPYGEIICTAKVTTMRKLVASDSNRALIDCSVVERYGLFVHDIKTVNIPVKGKQGIWYHSI